MPAKFVFRMIFGIAVALIALFLNAEGKLLASEPDLLMFLALLVIAASVVINIVGIGRWRQQQLRGPVENTDNVISVNNRRVMRFYKRWLIAIPILLIGGLWETRQQPTLMRIGTAAVVVCIYGYMYFVYKKLGTMAD